ncbi:MAG: hypothetical protein CMD38_04865 [Flavobacteriales bacterium]|nr:hypothetical protein [Flavobacteriales bacterium]
MNTSLFLIIFSSISFIYYGLNSLLSKKMHSEYSRWGYNNLRIFLAWCQLLGGCGLIIGMLHLSLNPLISITSFLLTIMMLTAVYTRIKSKDGLLLTLPSLFYSILNTIIFFQSI